MHFHKVSSDYINDLRNKLKEYSNVSIEAELDILKPMTPLNVWKKTNKTKDDYVACLVWVTWKEMDNIWPDFHLNDYCLFFDLEKTDQEFYYINKNIREIYKYSKTID